MPRTLFRATTPANLLYFYCFGVRHRSLLLSLILSVLLASCLEGSAHAQDVQWDSRHTQQQTLGAFLEPSYERALEQCKLAKLTKIVKHLVRNEEISLSSIPRIIQQRVPLASPVWYQDRRAIGTLFSYIYPSQDLANFQFDPRYSLSSEAGDREAAPMVLPGESMLLYTHNCSAILTAAGKAKISIPFANFQTALEADYSGSSKTWLAMTEGTFYSQFLKPFVTTPSNQDSPVGALLTLWDWYVSHPSEAIAGKSHFMMSTFHGTAMYEVEEQGRTADGSISANSDFGLALLSTSGEMKASLSGSSKAVIKSWSTAAYLDGSGKPEIVWMEIPTASKIVDTLSGYHTTLSTYHDTLDRDLPATHSQSMQGIPPSLCKKSKWEIQPDTSGIDLTLAVESDPAQHEVCIFNVTYNPNKGVSQNSDQVTLNYKLRSSTEVSGLKLFIQAQPVKYVTNHFPEIVQASYQKQPTVHDITGGKELKWEVPVIVNDDNIIDWSRQAIPRDIKIECGQDRGSFNVSIDPILLDQTKRTARMSLTYPTDSSERLDTDFTNPEKCKLLGSLSFFRRVQPTDRTIMVERSLPLLYVYFPRVKPWQLPVVSAGQPITITLPTDTIQLQGTASDPEKGTLQLKWNSASGPAKVSFTNPDQLTTQAAFTAPGEYTLTLTAASNRSNLSQSSTVKVTVNPKPTS